MNDAATAARDFHLDAIAFRLALPEDVETLHDLYLQLIPDEDPDTTDMRAALEIIPDNPLFGQIVIGEYAGAIIATCQVIEYDNLIRSPQRKAMIDSVVVADGYRHRGIGTKMMQWVLDNLGNATTSKIIVLTAYTRKEAHGLYGKMGFDQTGHSYIYSFRKKGDF
ncbi:MAG: GNAT family N-acetyltransferase [Rhodospirillaceae bacterium]